MKGEAIFRARMRAGISRRELSDRTEIRVGRLAEYENCKHQPGVAAMHAVACALEISFAELICDAGELVVGSGPCCLGSQKALPGALPLPAGIARPGCFPVDTPPQKR